MQNKESAMTLKNVLLLLALLASPLLHAQQQAVAVAVESDAALPTHTIYRPTELKGALPVVLWGNGSCVNSNFSYREFLTEIAAQGIIVVAIGPFRDSPPPRQQRPDDPAKWPPFETQAQQLLDGLDWISAENSRSASLFHQHIDTQHVAVMGHSCGAIQALKVSTDPRITTTLVMNSGLFPDGDQYMQRFALQRSHLSALHAPIAYFIGGETDVAYVNAEQDWQDLQALPLTAININLDVGHGATYAKPRGGEFAEAPIAWLRWRLLGDLQASSQFVGQGCGYCQAKTAWRLRTHKLD
jgi:dienelactone hydrolase